MGIDRYKWVCIFGAGNLLKFSSKQFHPLDEIAKLATESKDKGKVLKVYEERRMYEMVILKME